MDRRKFVSTCGAGPAPDGTIPDELQDILLEIGRWLEVNGNAINGTRPWKVFGEGPTRRKRNTLCGLGEIASPRLGPRDLRSTRKGPTLYAIVMGWPSGRRVAIKSLGRNSGLAQGKVSAVRLLGSESSSLSYLQAGDTLVITLPTDQPSEHTIALQIEGALERVGSDGHSCPSRSDSQP